MFGVCPGDDRPLHSRCFKADPFRGRVVLRFVALLYPGDDRRVLQITNRLDVERQIFVLDDSGLAQDRIRHNDYVVRLRVRRINDGKLGIVVMHEKVRGLAFHNDHVSFDGEQARHQFAQHHDDQAGVNQQNARSFPRELESDRVGRQQVGKQQPAEQPATGERESSRQSGRGGDIEENLPEAHEDLQRYPGKAGPEILVEYGPDAFVHLRQRAEEYEHDGEGHEDDGDPQSR